MCDCLFSSIYSSSTSRWYLQHKIFWGVFYHCVTTLSRPLAFFTTSMCDCLFSSIHISRISRLWFQDIWLLLTAWLHIQLYQSTTNQPIICQDPLAFFVTSMCHGPFSSIYLPLPLPADDMQQDNLGSLLITAWLHFQFSSTQHRPVDNISQDLWPFVPHQSVTAFLSFIYIYHQPAVDIQPDVFLASPVFDHCVTTLSVWCIQQIAFHSDNMNVLSKSLCYVFLLSTRASFFIKNQYCLQQVASSPPICRPALYFFLNILLVLQYWLIYLSSKSCSSILHYSCVYLPASTPMATCYQISFFVFPTVPAWIPVSMHLSIMLLPWSLIAVQGFFIMCASLWCVPSS
jgi:hypothetical protein